MKTFVNVDILFNNYKNLNYLNYYLKFIQTRSKTYAISEKHHIIPKSLGGSDDKDNIILLSLREHYIAHMLLSEALGGGMIIAYWFMINRFKDNNLNSREYERIRKDVSTLMSKKLKNKSLEERFGKEKAEKIKNKFSNARLGLTWDMFYGVEKADVMKQKMSNRISGKNNPGYKRTLEERKAVANKTAKIVKENGLLKGKNHPLYNIGHTEESKLKIKQNHAPCNGANNSRAKNWIVTDPKNKKFFINGTLKQFCIKHNLSYSILVRNRNHKIEKTRNKNMIGWILEELSG